MYIPLGGRKYKIMSLIIIFGFVIVWHELQKKLMVWGITIMISFFIEIILRTTSN